MTEEELDKLIELKKTLAKAIEFEKSEDEFAEEYFTYIQEDMCSIFYLVSPIAIEKNIIIKIQIKYSIVTFFMYFLLWLSIEKKSKNVGVWQYT